MLTDDRTPTRARPWLAAALRAWFRIEVSGDLRAEGPVVYVSNHLSTIDAPLIAALLGRPCRVALHAAPPKRGLAAWLWRRSGATWVDLSDAASARDLLRAVEAGTPLLLFPEARPSRHGALMKANPEAARLISACKAPVVPLHLDGLDQSPWAQTEPGHPRRLRPRVHVQVGAETLPSEDEKLTAQSLRDLMEQVRLKALSRWPTVLDALTATAKRNGTGRTVLEDPMGNALSLRRLAQGAAALGARLSRRTRPGEVVGLLLPGIATAPVLLAALWAKARVPAILNSTLGPGPAKAAVTAAGITQVISSRAFVEQAQIKPLIDALEAHGLDILWTEDLRTEIGPLTRLRALIATWRPAKARRDDPAVVLFTSGTEGTPKAVVLSHGNLLANVAQLRARSDVGPADRVLMALPLFHSLGLTGGLLFPLIAGARVVIYPSPLHYKIIPSLAYAHQATIIFGTDTFFAGWGRRAEPDDFVTIRAAITGAEPLKPATRSLWIDRFGVRLNEGYGATEASPVIAVNTPASDRFGSVGRILPGIETRLEEIPGLPGARLWVRGPNVMLGYMRVEQPGVLQPLSDGWYDTGDLVSIDVDGFVTLDGRIKRFAKIGGEMVSLAAVEGLAAETWPDATSAAIALPDPRKGERIVLALAGADPNRQAMQATARTDGLSELHLPSEIIRVEEIPLLASGKTDYPALTRLMANRGKAP